MKASIRHAHQLLAVEKENTVHAMLELQAPSQGPTEGRPPLHLALVIDRSGSMAGPKLHYAKQSAAYLARRLGPKDAMALVTYDDHVDLLASLGTLNGEQLAASVAAIHPGGTTNLSGGWLKGLEEVRRKDEDATRKVLLLTDGLANVGITDSKTLATMVGEAKTSGVGTSTIGFGAGFDEELLTDMAAAGAGNSHYVSSLDDAPAIFGEEFDDLVALVAQNVSVEIRPTSDVEVLGVLNEFPVTAVAGGLQVNVGDAYADESRRVIFELQIPSMAKLGVAQVAEIVVRYVTVGDEIAVREVKVPLTVNMVNSDEAGKEDPDAEVVEEVLILKSARAQAEARKMADEGDFEGAQEILRNTAQELRGAAPHSSKPDELFGDAEFLDRSADIAAPSSWDADASKSLHYDSFRKHQSRRNQSGRSRRRKRDE